MATDDRETFKKAKPERPFVVQSKKSSPSSQARSNNERWTMIEKEDAEQDDADWDIIDGAQVQEDYWEDYFAFNGCIMGVGKSATM